MLRIRMIAVVLGTVLVAAGEGIHAQDAATVPATTAPAVQALSATVTGIEGLVQVRDDGDSPWRAMQVGMVLGERAEFRTGPKSAVRFEIPGGHVITVDRLGIAKLLTAVQESGTTKTRVGMKYGRTRYDIEGVGRDHDSALVSPSTTLAIRGTRVSLFDQRPFKPEAVSLTGRAEFRDLRKRIFFGARGQGKTRVTTEHAGAAATSLTQSVTDPTIANARTQSEAGLIATLLSRGATVAFDRQSDLKIVTGGTPPTDAQLTGVLPGALNFVIRWSGNSNLDMGLSSPGGKDGGGEFLYPATGLNTNASGGRIPFDHRGGPNGGIEVAFWTGSYPKGLYGLGIVLASGNPTNAIVQAFLNGKVVPIYDGKSLVDKVVVPVFPTTIGEGTLGGIIPVGTALPTATRAKARVKDPSPLKPIREDGARQKHDQPKLPRTNTRLGRNRG
jgi:hypothetical protein